MTDERELATDRVNFATDERELVTDERLTCHGYVTQAL